MYHQTLNLLNFKLIKSEHKYTNSFFSKRPFYWADSEKTNILLGRFRKKHFIGQIPEKGILLGRFRKKAFYWADSGKRHFIGQIPEKDILLDRFRKKAFYCADSGKRHFIGQIPEKNILLGGFRKKKFAKSLKYNRPLPSLLIHPPSPGSRLPPSFL